MSKIQEAVEKLGGIVDYEDSWTVKCLFPEWKRSEVSIVKLKTMDARHVIVKFQPRRKQR